MNISKWITFEVDARGGEKSDEVESFAQSKLAKDVQTRLRNQADPGIDLKSARRAQAIRARAEGGQIIIDEEDQAEIIHGKKEQEESDSEPPASNLDDLFRPGSGVPEAVNQPDGTTKLVFRSIRAEDLFSQQIKGRRSEMVEQTVSNTLRTGTVEAIEEGFREMERLYPELNKK